MTCAKCGSKVGFILEPTKDGYDRVCRCGHTQPEPADAWIPPEDAA